MPDADYRPMGVAVRVAPRRSDDVRRIRRTWASPVSCESRSPCTPTAPATMRDLRPRMVAGAVGVHGDLDSQGSGDAHVRRIPAEPGVDSVHHFGGAPHQTDRNPHRGVVGIGHRHPGRLEAHRDGTTSDAAARAGTPTSTPMFAQTSAGTWLSIQPCRCGVHSTLVMRP